MRRWIDLFEVKIVDDFYSSVSGIDLQILAAKGDMRGIAYNNKIYLEYAYDDYHHGMRNKLGIEACDPEYKPEYGFDFYIAPFGSEYEGIEGREDWLFSPANFIVGGYGIWTNALDDLCLKNSQFSRLVSGRYNS